MSGHGSVQRISTHGLAKSARLCAASSLQAHTVCARYSRIRCTATLLPSLKKNRHLVVLGEVQLGELLCDSLAAAEDAPLLQFELSVNEVSNSLIWRRAGLDCLAATSSKCSRHCPTGEKLKSPASR